MELTPPITGEDNQNEPSNIKSIRRRPIILALNGLRGLASLWVFSFHAVSQSPAIEYNTIPIGWMGRGGVAGVALFYCLSGWVMVWIYSDCEFKSFRCYWSFIGRRIARLFPLYYLSLIISINDVRCIWSADQSCTTANWIYIMLTLLGIRAWIPYVFANSNWNSVVWSIQVELFFYLSFPFLLRFIRYLVIMNNFTSSLDDFSKRKVTTRLYLLWFLVFCVSGLFLIIRLLIHGDSSKQSEKDPISTLYHTAILRITEFILGMITCILFILKSSNNINDSNEPIADVMTALISKREQKQHDTVRSSFQKQFSSYERRYFAFDIYFLCQILFFIIIYSPLVDKHGQLTMYNYIISVGPIISLIACIILYFSSKYQLSLSSKLLSSSLLKDVGSISFPFYCLVEALPQLVLLITGVPEQSGIMRFWAGIGVATFLHFYFEMPIYEWANRKLPKCRCT